MSRLRVERCTCGQTPDFVAAAVAEDAVESQYVCQTGYRLPGGGMTRKGCGKQGPEVEDAYSDEPTAAASWNAMIRAEKRALSEHQPKDQS